MFSLVLPSKTGSGQEQATVDHARGGSKKGFSSSVFSIGRQGLVEREEEPGATAQSTSEWGPGIQRPGWSWRPCAPAPPLPCPLIPRAGYLFEAGPALAEAQAGAGVGLDHHLPTLLGLGRVVEPAPHRVAPVGRQAAGGSILWSGGWQSHTLPLHPPPRSRETPPCRLTSDHPTRSAS